MTLWCMLLPCVLIWGDGELVTLWTFLPMAYGVMQVMLLVIIFRTNWSDHAHHGSSEAERLSLVA